VGTDEVDGELVHAAAVALINTATTTSRGVDNRDFTNCQSLRAVNTNCKRSSRSLCSLKLAPVDNLVHAGRTTATGHRIQSVNEADHRGISV
jgi:hypothetical protein